MVVDSLLEVASTAKGHLFRCQEIISLKKSVVLQLAIRGKFTSSRHNRAAIRAKKAPWIVINSNYINIQAGEPFPSKP
jgi:hypothetical protein